MKVAIYGKRFDERFVPQIQKLFDKFEKEAVELLVYDKFSEFLQSHIKLNGTVQLFSGHEDIQGRVDYLFSVGGDGTFLNTATLVRDSGIPVVGVNAGRLGFLSSISLEEVNIAVDMIKEGRYRIAERTMIKLETENNLFGDNNFALNELTLIKKNTSSMITINVYLDNEFLNSYWADGLIVSTATGSTAYSMSCAGPIIIPGSNNFVITPVAPHNLNVRPIVIPDHSKLTLDIEGRGDNFLVSLDSRSEAIGSNIELTISKNNFGLNVLRLDHHSYLGTLRNKLNWGLDKRN